MSYDGNAVMGKVLVLSIVVDGKDNTGSLVFDARQRDSRRRMVPREDMMIFIGAVYGRRGGPWTSGSVE